MKIRKPDAVAVSSSGGKDSVVVLSIAADQAEAWGVPLIVVHADMGRMEWSGSMALVEAQADHFGARLMVVRRDGDLLSQCIEKRRWSRVGMANCQGTSDHKRGPIWTAYTQIAKEWREANPGADRRCEILEVIGLARHEGGVGGARDKLLREMDEADLGGRTRVNVDASNKTRRQVVSWYPISEWTEQAVWDRLAADTLRGAPEAAWPYAQGMPRYSCTFCVFAPREALNLAAQLAPALFAEYLAAEQIIGPWRREFTLADIAADLAAGRLVKSASEWGNQA